MRFDAIRSPLPRRHTAFARPARAATAALLAALATATLAACNGSDDGPGGLPQADAATITAIEAVIAKGPSAVVDGRTTGCDFLDERHCLLPYPSDAYTIADPSSATTGVRVAMPADGMPVNTDGVQVDPTEWNRNDGFSPNSTILTRVPGLDATASRLPSWTDLGASLDPDASVVVLDRTTGLRLPAWAELDVKAPVDDQYLAIHAAVVLPEGHEIVVAMRGLRRADGQEIAPNPVFRVYRDRLGTGIDVVEARRPVIEGVFESLGQAGVARETLQLAWSFTVASKDNLSRRMLAIRDAALADLGDSVPGYTITSIRRDPHSDVALQVAGTFEVPNFLDGEGEPGQGFHYASTEGPDRLPVRNGTLSAPFLCNIPSLAMPRPARLALYGHGLLGSHEEIDYGTDVREFALAHDVLFCATKWAGLSEDDIANSIATLQEISNFRTGADRMQQGILNFIVLGRLMLHPRGFRADPAFGGIAFGDELSYDGNSQGGIMGGALVAVSPDIRRGVLGVPGINYSLLLPRSVDFDLYETVMTPAYPSASDRLLLIALMQMLWDRGEGGGYAQHTTSDGYPGTPPKKVLLHVALGDWQVTELAAMVQARAYGASKHAPLVRPGRSREREPGWGIPDIDAYPFDGSALVFWDSGSDLVPLEPTPPRTSRDPHEDPREYVEAERQKAAFLFEDRVIDVCGGQACEAPPLE